MQKPTLVIHHSADFDGIFCREIARSFFGPDADYVGWDCGDPVPDASDYLDLYILDLSIPELMAHPRLTWIDHHRTAIERFPAAIPGLRIDGVAACRLAWQWFYGHRKADRADYVDRRVEEPLAIQLAGEYDVWDKRDPRADRFQHGLRSRDLEPIWRDLLACGGRGFAAVDALLVGGAAVEYANTKGAEFIIQKHGFTVDFEGRRFLALNTARSNSLAFLAGLRPEHEGCLSFNWSGRDWRVSLYGVPGKPDIDFTPIAQKYGGGGHRQACGFRTPWLPFVQPVNAQDSAA